MASETQNPELDGVPLARLESASLRVDVAPSVGGRIVSMVDKATGHEFLWRNRSLQLARLEADSEYDPNFFGGVDELLPNDISETIDGVACPDHGELWTLALSDVSGGGSGLFLKGDLPRCGLRYERRMALRGDEPFLDIDYRITNPTAEPRRFLWKLHAALAIEPGDIIDCPADLAQVVDTEYSRFSTLEPFAWPLVEGCDASAMPPANGSMDFFYLYKLREGRMGWRRPGANLEFAYHFDPRVFPFAWLFASYGGFLGHETAVLEPCTTMPISVNDAAAKRQCSILQPGESLETRVSIRAGRILAP